jgi:hypothetical protein
MALNTSGKISLAGTVSGESIQKELGGNGTTQISLNDPAVRSLAGKPTGAVSMPSNFYGKSSEFYYTVAADTANLNLTPTFLQSLGWGGFGKVYVSISLGVRVYSSSTSNAALRISGTYPNGIEIVNNGNIIGRGGNGGNGGNQSAGTSGGNGGVGLDVSTNVTFNNVGLIAGGGGGGGGGGSAFFNISSSWNNGSGGGGGRTGLTNSSGGSGVVSGGTGTISGAGAGGSGGGSSYAGGSGGGYGASGSAGQNGSGGNINNNGGTGGAGGNSVVGNSFITWVATGTRAGAVS